MPAIWKLENCSLNNHMPSTTETAASIPSPTIQTVDSPSVRNALAKRTAPTLNRTITPALGQTRVKPSLNFISAPPLANKHDATITAAIRPVPSHPASRALVPCCDTSVGSDSAPVRLRSTVTRHDPAPDAAGGTGTECTWFRPSRCGRLVDGTAPTIAPSWPSSCAPGARRSRPSRSDCPAGRRPAHAGPASRRGRAARRRVVTWYTWLEQGRRINASPDVLSRDRAGAAARRRRPSSHLLALAQPSPSPVAAPVARRARWCG